MNPLAQETNPLAQMIRVLRQNANLSMADIEERVNVSRSVVSRAENGTSIPNEATLKLLEDVFDAKNQLTTLRESMIKREGSLLMGYPPLLSAAPLLMLAHKHHGPGQFVASHAYRLRPGGSVELLVDTPVMLEAGGTNGDAEPFTIGALKDAIVAGTLDCAWVPRAVSASLQDSVTRLASLRVQGFPTDWLVFTPAATGGASYQIHTLADAWAWPGGCEACLLAESDGDKEYGRLRHPSGRRPPARRCPTAAALVMAASLALRDGRAVLCLVSEPLSTFLTTSLRRAGEPLQVTRLERQSADYDVNYLAETGQNGLDFVFNNRALARIPPASIREVLETVRKFTRECDRPETADLEYMGTTLNELPLARVRECLATYGGFELTLSHEALKLLN